jgi:hypothetical protein
MEFSVAGCPSTPLPACFGTPFQKCVCVCILVRDRMSTYVYTYIYIYISFSDRSLLVVWFVWQAPQILEQAMWTAGQAIVDQLLPCICLMPLLPLTFAPVFDGMWTSVLGASDTTTPKLDDPSVRGPPACSFHGGSYSLKIGIDCWNYNLKLPRSTAGSNCRHQLLVSTDGT